MRRLIAAALAALLTLVVAGACDPNEPPIAPGTPDPFSSPGASPDGPPLPP